MFFLTGQLGVFGLGYGDLTAGLNQQLPWEIAGVLLAGEIAGDGPVLRLMAVAAGFFRRRCFLAA